MIRARPVVSQRPLMLMETETMLPADLAPVAAPALTPWGMYLAADVVVKAVMIALALASLATWTILLAKGWELTRQARQLRAARALLLQSAQLPPQSEEASQQQGIALWNRADPQAVAPGGSIYVPLRESVLKSIDPAFNSDVATFIATQPVSP